MKTPQKKLTDFLMVSNRIEVKYASRTTLNFVVTILFLLLNQSEVQARVPFGAHPAGTASSFPRSPSEGFTLPARNLPFEKRLDFFLGEAIFRKTWVSSPASTKSSDGLGPLHNARSCVACHTGNLGSSVVPKNSEQLPASLLIRLSIPPQSPRNIQSLSIGKVGSIDDPTYGGQLQTRSIAGSDPEGEVLVNWEYKTVKIKKEKNQNVELRRPIFRLRNLKYGKPHKDLMMSPRLANTLIGLGLLELISEDDIQSNLDPGNKNADGVSGKINWVWNREKSEVSIGRFGWKAGQPTINQQNQAAFNGDLGLSVPLFVRNSGDCTFRQRHCISHSAPINGDSHKLEAPNIVTDAVLFYIRYLTVPISLNSGNVKAIAGQKIFRNIGCASCHRPTYTTQNSEAHPELSNQKIWPYTDLLLHDMGPELADNRPEFQASGREWRTQPLWGLSSREKKAKFSQLNFLHDGRARTLTEAILWHGGESLVAREKFRLLGSRNRDFLLYFLNTL